MTEKPTLSATLQDFSDNWPEFDRPETRVMLGLIRLNDLVVESTRELLTEHGLSPSAFEALITLRGQPEPWIMTPTALADAILITTGGMTKVIKQLEQGELVRRVDNPDDKRSRYLQLTPNGKLQAETAMEAVSAHDRILLEQALNAQQIHQLSKVLLRTVNKIEDQQKASPAMAKEAS
ncbi:MarR family transcriptional regulator [uncultured Shimia sp.]|uniref:MarR family winged helix-turn-helix transcriptional regulator n=1 Tax=uncultured Shimia sp. TaxID=573152 RepID=UPI00263040A7|nr:MarR family transcriptional regulator [uncultured Shimia sp.]